MGSDDERAGSLLREYRRAAGLSQRELAGAADVSIGVVRDLEQGRTRRLTAQSAQVLAVALGLNAGCAMEFTHAAYGTPQPAVLGGPVWVRLGVLGPLAAWRGGAVVELGPASQRAVLGLLALSPGEVVSRESLIDAWWGQDPPASAASLVQARVGRLRRILDPGRPASAAGGLLASVGVGYRLEVSAGQLDLLEFADLAGRGDAARRAGQAAVACGLYERALGSWRGDPLADIGALRGHPAVTGLSQRRAEVIVACAESACELGWYERALAAAWPLAEREPLDEAAHAVLMTALAGAGRQAAALEVFEGLRRRLDEQLGVRPGAGLVAAHLRVLRGDLPAPAPATAAHGRAAVRYSLPLDTAAFTGREGELARITAATAPAAGGVIAIRAIGGMPGVGKTALAVRAAHLLAREFPDRQLFVSLHGHTPGRDPVAPSDALAGLLASAGVDPRYLPEDLDGRAALWRDKMAGQRALLVLDNAASSSQVAPLLPGGAGWLVLVTSRRHLGDLPGAVTPVLLDVLAPPEAVAMFTRLAPRAAGDPGGVAEVVALTGFLPLAVGLLARVFARHRSWTLGDLAREVRAGVLTLAAESDSVAAAFEVSCRHLDPGQQRLFWLLGVHPGTVTDSYAAAALAGIDVGEAAGLLDGLHAEGLVTETGHRRYGMHDLLRRYARDQAGRTVGAGEGERALGRLLDYYQQAATLAEALLARQARPGPAPVTTVPLPAAPVLQDAGQALDWARAERASLLACLDHLTHAGQHARVVALTAALAELFRRDGPWADAITRHATAIRAARHRGDRLGEAGALRSLGEVRQLTGDFPGAARDLEQALGIYRDLGDRLGEAGALRSLGDARQMTDDYPAAARDLEQALDIYRDLGDRRGEAGALTRLGEVRRLTGDYPGAARDQEQALGIFRDLGDRLGEANALYNLGEVRRRTGEYSGAARDLKRALGIDRDLGDRLGEANALYNLGVVLRLTGDYPAAAQGLEQALGIYRDLGDRRGEGNAISELGVVRQLTGDHPGAAQGLEQALGIFRDLGDRGSEANVLNDTGTLHRVSGDLARAGECHQQALELARAIASPWDEAHALAGLGRCAIAAGHAVQAQALLRQAQQVFQRIGAAETHDVLAELDTLTRPGYA